MASMSVTTVVTWGFRAGPVSSVSRPAPMASWTLAPMPFSSGRRTSSFRGSTPPVAKGRAGYCTGY